MTEMTNEVKTEAIDKAYTNTTDEPIVKSSGCNIFLETQPCKRYEKSEYHYTLVDANDKPRENPSVHFRIDLVERIGVLLEADIYLELDSTWYRWHDDESSDRNVVVSIVEQLEKLEVIDKLSLHKLGFERYEYWYDY